MHRLWVTLVLIATLVFWTSGTAQFVHAQTAHAGQLMLDDNGDFADAPTAAADELPQTASARLAWWQRVVAERTSHSTAAKPTPHHHSSCPVCTMLAHMTTPAAAPPSSPPIVLVLNPLAVPAPPSAQLPRLRGALPLCARGPPADSVPFAA